MSKIRNCASITTAVVYDMLQYLYAVT